MRRVAKLLPARLSNSDIAPAKWIASKEERPPSSVAHGGIMHNRCWTTKNPIQQYSWKRLASRLLRRRTDSCTDDHRQSTASGRTTLSQRAEEEVEPQGESLTDQQPTQQALEELERLSDEMDADETAAQAWDRYFLGPPPKAKTPKLSGQVENAKVVRFSDQPPARSYDDIIAAHQSPPRPYDHSTGVPLPIVPPDDHLQAAYLHGDRTCGSRRQPSLLYDYNADTTWLEPLVIEQYVNDVVDDRIAAARRADQLRVIRRKQILGMTT